MQEWMQECSRSQWECWSSGQSVGGVEGLSRSAAAVSTIVSGVHATGMQQESADATGVQQERAGVSTRAAGVSGSAAGVFCECSRSELCGRTGGQVATTATTGSNIGMPCWHSRRLPVAATA